MRRIRIRQEPGRDTTGAVANGAGRDDLGSQFAAFLVVGLFGFAAHYGTLILLAEGARLDPVLASATGFVAGGLTNYIMNYRFTFRSDKRHVQALPQFALVALVGLVLNTLFMTVLVKGLGAHYVASQIATTALLTLWHFGANRIWTFRQAGSAR